MAADVTHRPHDWYDQRQQARSRANTEWVRAPIVLRIQLPPFRDVATDPRLRCTTAFSSMPTTFARRQGWLKVSPTPEEESAESGLAIEDKWRKWRDREEIRRLGFGAIVSPP